MLNSIRKYAQELQFISNDYKKVVKENELWKYYMMIVKKES
jgi:hypothetical protein